MKPGRILVKDDGQYDFTESADGPHRLGYSIVAGTYQEEFMARVLGEYA